MSLQRMVEVRSSRMFLVQSHKIIQQTGRAEDFSSIFGWMRQCHMNSSTKLSTVNVGLCCLGTNTQKNYQQLLRGSNLDMILCSRRLDWPIDCGILAPAGRLFFEIYEDMHETDSCKAL